MFVIIEQLCAQDSVVVVHLNSQITCLMVTYRNAFLMVVKLLKAEFLQN